MEADIFIPPDNISVVNSYKTKYATTIDDDVVEGSIVSDFGFTESFDPKNDAIDAYRQFTKFPNDFDVPLNFGEYEFAGEQLKILYEKYRFDKPNFKVAMEELGFANFRWNRWFGYNHTSLDSWSIDIKAIIYIIKRMQLIGGDYQFANNEAFSKQMYNRRKDALRYIGVKLNIESEEMEMTQVTIPKRKSNLYRLLPKEIVEIIDPPRSSSKTHYYRIVPKADFEALVQSTLKEAIYGEIRTWMDRVLDDQTSKFSAGFDDLISASITDFADTHHPMHGALVKGIFHECRAFVDAFCFYFSMNKPFFTIPQNNETFSAFFFRMVSAIDYYFSSFTLFKLIYRHFNGRVDAEVFKLLSDYYFLYRFAYGIYMEFYLKVMISSLRDFGFLLGEVPQVSYLRVDYFKFIFVKPKRINAFILPISDKLIAIKCRKDSHLFDNIFNVKMLI